MTIQEAMEELGKKRIILTSAGENVWIGIQLPAKPGGQSVILARGDSWQEVYKRITKKPYWRLPESV